MRRFGLVFVASFLVFGVLGLGSGLAHADTYKQTVDNKTSGRFSASAKIWDTSSYSSQRYGADYRYTRPRERAYYASWKIKVPAGGAYNVYVRHPADSGYNSRAAYRVRTAGGWKAKTVDQRSGGGTWKKLGRYTLEKGDAYWLRLSSKSSGNNGYVVADAVKIVRATSTTSSDGGPGDSGGATTGADIVAEASKYIGEDYEYGGTSPSTGFDCSGFTQYVYKQFGITLPRTARDQYESGPGTKVSSTPRAGDLVFGNTSGGSTINHVGIITGDGYMIHAGTEQTGVQKVKFPASWYTVVGYRRIL